MIEIANNLGHRDQPYLPVIQIDPTDSAIADSEEGGTVEEEATKTDPENKSDCYTLDASRSNSRMG